MIKIGINGMGRIGRLVLRSALGGVTRVTADNNANTQLEITHLNEINSGAETIAHLLEFDTVHGRWKADIASNENSITINDHNLSFSSYNMPEDIDWADFGCSIVFDCTGKF